MEEIKYTDTWCDNITPCPYLENVWVNDYDCDHCPHNKGRKDEDNSIDEFIQDILTIEEIYCRNIKDLKL